MLKRLALSLALIVGLAVPAAPALAASGSVSDTFSADEIVKTGGEFFGSVSQGLASLVEKAASQFGLPNGYILGEEGSGAFVIGGRYGQGTLYTRNKGDYPAVLAGPVDRHRFRRRRLQGHDAGLQSQLHQRHLQPLPRRRRLTSTSSAASA